MQNIRRGSHKRIASAPPTVAAQTSEVAEGVSITTVVRGHLKELKLPSLAD